MENLDNDVLENILFRLPLGAAAQAKLVCKSWKTILDERRHDEVGYLFACHVNENKQIQHYFGEEYDHIDSNKMNYYYSHPTLMKMEHCSFVFKYVQSSQGDILVGSCNGLVCFQKWDPDTGMAEPFAISNPLTGEFIFLKINSGRAWDDPKQVASGFGYCQSTKEYKVVRVCSLDGQQSHVQVYTLGSNKWRDMETPIDYIFNSTGVFANGVLHWLDENEDGSDVVTFDLEDEEFRLLPVPPPSEALERHQDSVVVDKNKLKLLGGNLCYLFQRSSSYIDIWAYKRDDQKLDYYLENSWNWVRQFIVECDYYPFAITKSNQLLMTDNHRFMNFYFYDRKARFEDILGDDDGIIGVDCSYIEAIPHANSYVSLKDFGETWYWPGSGCSTVRQTNNNYDMLEDVREAYQCRRRNRQSFVYYFVLFFIFLMFLVMGKLILANGISSIFNHDVMVMDRDFPRFIRLY